MKELQSQITAEGWKDVQALGIINLRCHRLGHLPTIGIIIQDASEQIRWGLFEGGIGFQGKSFPFIAARELPAL